MSEESGALDFATGVDTSGYDEGLQHMEEATSNLVNTVEDKTSQINDLLNDIPEINLEIVGNVTNLDQIESALLEVDRVVDENTKGVRLLEERYKQLAEVRKQLAEKGQKGRGEDVQLHKEQQAILQVIEARKKAIDEAGKQGDALLKLEAKLKTQAEAVNQNANAQASLRQRLRELKMELVEMEAAGMRGTEQYRATQEEVAKLTDAWGDAQAQANILANDQRGFAGVMSGLSGLSGALSAAQGAVGLFGGANEDLQKIMVRLQSVMAITMGLQQVQQTLNKDSAFSLVTLNGLKEWWNKLLAIGAGEQAVETEATIANTVAQEADAAATTANAAAHEGKAVAATGAAAAEGVDTAATGANAVAAGAGTVANIGLAGAFRMVGAAIKSIPVFGWIAAAIGVLIGVISHFIGKADEMSEQVKENNELMKDARKKYVETSLGIKDMIAKIDEFNGSAEDEKRLLDEVNNKYGEAIGYSTSLADAKSKLIQKGPALCEMYMQEAKAQAVLTKATEAYIHWLEVQDEYDKKKAGLFQSEAQFQREKNAAIAKAKAEYQKWENQYAVEMGRARQIARNNDLGGHTAPTAVRIRGGNATGPNNTYTAKDAERDAAEAADAFTTAYNRYIEQATTKMRQSNLQFMQDGLAKLIAQNDADFDAQKQEWIDMLQELANAKKEYAAEIYASQHGGKLDGWENTDEGKRTDEEWRQVVLDENLELAQQFNDQMERLETERVLAQIRINKEYTDALIEQYGTTADKIELLTRRYQTSVMNGLPEEFWDEAERQLDAQIAALQSEDFKKSINWDVVFGDMGKQNISVLQHNLDKVRQYFEANKNSMGVEQIKDYQEAITKLEGEINSRNPFVALHRSIQDISASKTEFANACTAFAEAQRAVNEAQQEYNAALELERSLQAETDDDGNIIREQQEGYAEAVHATAVAYANLTTAQQKGQRAEQQMLTARNNITVAYKNFASNLNNVGGVVKDVGGKAKNLAKVFSDDVADSIEKAIDFVTDMLDATSSVINAIGDVGKGVAKGVEATVDATAQGATAAAATGATAISTIEKASVILTVISAALQVATAIANLFNNDDAKQKEIEKLQGRIDQLQWELDNAETTRLMGNVGSAVEKLNKLYEQTYWTVLNLHGVTQQSSKWSKWIASARYEGEIYRKTVEALADAYASVDYTANKALGTKKYADSRKQLENYSEQMLLMQKQINEESSKKKTDNGKIEDWKRQMEEIANEMANLINDMLEDIIGSSAEDLAKTLGEAFIEAAQQGEDAMEAWHDKVNEIVADILKRMLITKFLEEPLGQIFDRYKKKWFGDDGQFKGIDAVINSMQGFSDDLNKVGEDFQAIWNALPDSIKDWFPDESEREGQQRGIATASQDSVDENNARLTTIQGHTYNIQQGLVELNRTTNAILDKVTGIEKNTSEANEKLDEMNDRVRKLNNTVDDIQTHGIKLK